MAYGGRFAVEAVSLARFFAAARAFWGGARWHFGTALVAALLLSTISIAAQVWYLELDALKGTAHIPAGALDDVPIVGGGRQRWTRLTSCWVAPAAFMSPGKRGASCSPHRCSFREAVPDT